MLINSGEGPTKCISDAIEACNKGYGRQPFDSALVYLYQSRLITLDEALRGTTNPHEFRLRRAGINTTAGIAKEEMERTSGVGNVSDLVV